MIADNVIVSNDYDQFCSAWIGSIVWKGFLNVDVEGQLYKYDIDI
jgi:hypothetical protein